MKIEKTSPLREGKAKILFLTNQPDEYLIQHFKDDATAFNAQKRGQIANKGIVNNAVTSWLYTHLAAHGIKTHFVQKLSERDMVVRKVEIIPVEMVVRNRAAGSIVKRLGIEKGKALEPALVEFFYKSDELGDPLIGEGHIFYFKWATPQELSRMVHMSLDVNRILRSLFRELGLDLVDFKLELGRDMKTGEILLADEFSPDGSRLWDLKTGEPMDKDRFRQDLGGVEDAYQEVYRRLQNHFEGTK